MGKRDNEFEQIEITRMKIAWCIFIPLYFYILRNLIITPILSILKVSSDEKITYLYGHMIFQILMFTGIIILFFPMLKESLFNIKNESWKKVVKCIMKGLVCIIAACFVGAAIEYICYSGKMIPSQNEMSIREIIEVAPIPVFISSVILGPFVEEMIFRFVIYRTFRKINVACGMIVSALAFGFIHIENALLAGDTGAILSGITYVVMGLAFSHNYEKNKNIIMCTIIHSIYNLFVQSLH